MKSGDNEPTTSAMHIEMQSQRSESQTDDKEVDSNKSTTERGLQYRTVLLAGTICCIFSIVLIVTLVLLLIPSK